MKHLLLLVTLPLSACTTVNAVQQLRLETGTPHVYSTRDDTLALAVKRAFIERGLGLVHDTVQDGARIVMAARPVPLLGCGEIARAVLAPSAEAGTEVRLLSLCRRGLAAPTTQAPHWFTRLDRQLDGRGLGPFRNSYVRMTQGSGSSPVTGVLLDADSAGSMILQVGRERTSIPRAQVVRIDVSRGQVHHAAAGEWVGLLVGLPACWFGLRESYRDSGDEAAGYALILYTPVCAVASSLVGKALGSQVKRHVWSEVKDR